MIGRTVEVQTPTGPVVGTVTTLNFEQGQPFLNVTTAQGQSLVGLTLNQITLVR